MNEKEVSCLFEETFLGFGKTRYIESTLDKPLPWAHGAPKRKKVQARVKI